MLRFTFLLLGLFMSIAQLTAQEKVIIEGYVYEENDRGFIGDAEVKLYTSQMISVAKATTDEFGHFIFETTADRQYVVRANKKLYFQNEQKVDPATKNAASKVFLKMEMEREPGYVFDVTLAEPRPAPNVPTNSVEDATIEIYNNTTKKMVWVAENHPSPYFKFTFQQGNHYTIMISKKRYITKQIEAYVNVKGCIVCIEGVDDVKPGIVDNLTQGHQKGVLLANIELRPITIGETIPIDNLYYKSGKYAVEKSMHKTLDELIVLMVNNPSLIVELRSHTDCKGDDKLNNNLSMKRAKSAVDYMLANSDIDEYRIKAIGMGEKSPVSKCKSCETCSDKELARDRRTELVITGLLAQKEKEKLPLTARMEEIRMTEMLNEVLGGGQIQVPEGADMPEELKKQIEEDKRIAQAQQAKLSKESVPTPDVAVKREKVPVAPVPPPAQEVEETVEDIRETVEVKEVVKEKPLTEEEKVAKAVLKSVALMSDAEKKEMEEAKRRAAEAFEGKPAVVQDPGLSDVVVSEKVKPVLSEEVKPVLSEKEKVAKAALKSVATMDKKEKKELEEAERRAAEAFEEKPAVVHDPGVNDVVVTEKMKPEKEVNIDEVSKPKKRLVKEVNLSDMDISRKVGGVAEDYIGYKVEVKRTRYELPLSDIIFSSYSDIALYRNTNGDYVYLTGNFATRTVANIGLDYIRKDRPKAKLHLFRNGKMVD